MEHKGRDKDGGNFFPLKSKFIFMYTAVMVTVILVIVLIIGLKTSSMLKEKSVGNCVQELNFVMERLDTLLSKIDNESVLLTTNLAKVQSTLTSEPNLQYQQYERFQEMSKFMMEFLVNHSGISSVTYYDRDGGVFYKGNYDTSVQQTSTMPKEIVAFNRSQSKTDWYVDMTKIPSGKSIVNFYFLKKSYGTYTHTFNGQWAPIGNQVSPWYTADGKCNIKAAGFIKALENRKKLDDEGIQLSFNQIKATKASQASNFLGGKCAMVQAGSWIVSNIKDTKNYPHDFRIGVAPLPRFDETVKAKNNFCVAATILAIPASSTKKDQAWRFIRYFVEKGAERVAATGNYPSYRPAYNDALIKTFIEGSKLELSDAKVLFNDINVSTQKPTGIGSAAYQLAMQEQTQLYFNGEKTIKEVTDNIEKATNVAIEKEKSEKK